MNKIKYIIFITLLIFINFSNINAECSKEIQNEASKVKIDKKVLTNIIEDEIYFQIQVKPLTENLYVNVYESEDGTSKNYYYKDTDKGLLKINSHYLYDKIMWTAKVYSNNGECKGELLKTLSVETPKYNDYYTSEECKRTPIPQYCDFFADTSDINRKEFLEIMNQYEEMLNPESENKFFKFILKYYLYALIPVVIISLIYIFRIIKLKKNMKK